MNGPIQPNALVGGQGERVKRKTLTARRILPETAQRSQRVLLPSSVAQGEAVTRYLSFTDEARSVIDEAFDLAPRIWGDCGFETVRVAAGNVARYGAHVALYKVDSRLIEIPLNPGFGLLKVTADGIAPANERRLLGVVLHEIGHHVERHHPTKPWTGLRAGYSTHSRASWCWVAAKGWQFFFPDIPITPEFVANCARSVPGAPRLLAAFEPNVSPDPLLDLVADEQNASLEECAHCGQHFERARSDARYCSSRCRVAAHRSRGGVQ
jgi:hypothetical protein